MQGPELNRVIRQVAVVAFVCGAGAPPKYVLQRRRTSETWKLVKGTIEENETLEETVRRECREEAGVEVGGIVGTLGAYSYRKRFAAEPREFDVTVVLAKVLSVRDRYREQGERERCTVTREIAAVSLQMEAERYLLWRALDGATIFNTFET